MDIRSRACNGETTGQLIDAAAHRGRSIAARSARLAVPPLFIYGDFTGLAHWLVAAMVHRQAAEGEIDAAS